MLATRDADYIEGVDALRAWREGIITEEEYLALMKHSKERLSDLKVEDLNLRGTHILLSRQSGKLIRDQESCPVSRICNFELLRMSDCIY